VRRRSLCWISSTETRRRYSRLTALEPDLELLLVLRMNDLEVLSAAARLSRINNNHAKIALFADFVCVKQRLLILY
jgi:hypothetical protein